MSNILFTLSLVILIQLLSSIITGVAGQTNKKPNVLIILADDVGTENVPGYWGNEIVDMPNIRALQEKGVTFMDAHSTSLCAPSRYMLLSGNYPHRGTEHYGTWDINRKGQSQFYGRQKSIASMMKTGGYRTSMFGKWHIGAGLPGTFDKDKLLSSQDWENGRLSNGPHDHGFDDSFYSDSGIQAAPYAFFRNGKLVGKEEDIVYWEKGEHTSLGGEDIEILESGEGVTHWDSTKYNKKIFRKAEKFLDNHIENHPDMPWFMYFALGSVHVPHTPPNKYFNATKVAGEYGDPHLDLLYEMDLIIGSLLKKLEEINQIEDTIIIFTSDNGGLNMNNPYSLLRGYKGSIFEGGHRIPFVMRYDNVLPADEKRNEHYISLADIYATIGDFVDLTIDEYSAQDSKSFMEYALSSSANAPRTYLPVHKHRNKKGIHQAAMRYGNYKFIRDYDKKLEALYNLKDDIGEKHNLLSTDFQSYNALRKKLRNRLRRSGLCPADRTHTFQLKNGKRSGERVDCSFFETYTESKCYWQPIGEIMCNSFCGRHRKFCKLWESNEAEFPADFLEK